MRRIRNSVKALIISICLVVVLAGSIVGVVLATRNKGKGDGDPTNPTNPVTPAIKYELTEDQKALVESINKNASTSVETAIEFNPSDYVTKNGDKYEQIDLSTISTYGDGFLKAYTDKGSTYYIEKEDETRTYYLDVCELLDIDGTVYSTKALDAQKNYMSFYVLYSSNDTNNLMMVLLDSKTNNVLENYVVEDFGDYPSQSELTNELAIFLYEDIYYYTTSNKVGDVLYTNVKISTYDGSVSKTHTILRDREEDYRFRNSNFLIKNEDKYIAGYYNGSEIVTYEMEIENFSKPYFANNLIFIEHKKDIEKIEDKKPTTIKGSDYSYSCIDMTTGLISTYDIGEGYAKAYFNTDVDGFYGVFKHKIDSNENLVDGKIEYFKYDGTKVIEYHATSIDDKILYYSKNRFLTKKGLFTCKNSIVAESVVEFGSDDFEYSLSEISEYVSLINNDTFIVSIKESPYYYICDLDGNFVYENFFLEIESYGDGYYFANDGINDYILNVGDSSKTIVENYSDEYDLIYQNTGIYFVQKGSTLTMFNFKGVEICDNIKSYSFTAYEKNTILTIQLENKNLYYLINYRVGESVDEYSSSDYSDVNNEVDLYHDYSDSWGEKGSVPLSGEVNGIKYVYSFSGNSWEIKIDVPQGYILSSSSFVIDRNNGNDNKNLYVECSHNAAGEGACPNGTVTSGPAASFDSNSSIFNGAKHYSYTIKGTVIDFDGWINGDFVGGGEGDELWTMNLNKTAITMSIIYANMSFADGTHSASHGTYHPNSASYGSTFSVSNPTRNGFTFTGWKIEKGNNDTDLNSISGTDGSYRAIPIYTGQSVQFTAKWEPVKYTIHYTYDTNDNVSSSEDWDVADTYKSYNVSSSEQTIIPESSGKLAPYKNGYTFTGWTISTNCSKNAASTPVDASAGNNYIKIPAGCYGNIVVSANWENNKYKVTFVFGQVGSTDTNIHLLLKSQFDSGVVNALEQNQTAQGIMYAKYGSTLSTPNNSGNPPTADNYNEGDFIQIAKLKSFTYQPGLVMNNNYLYDWETGFDTFNPSNESKFNFAVFFASYQIVDWAYEYDNSYKLVSDSAKMNLIDYLCSHNKVTGDGNEDVVFYAVYEPKEYYAHWEHDLDNGRGSVVANSNVDDINNEYKDYNSSLKITYNEWNETETTVTDVNEFNLYSSNSPMFKILIDNNSLGNDDFYVFDRIEITKLGYKINSTTYGFQKIVYTNPGPEGAWVPVVYDKGGTKIDTVDLYKSNIGVNGAVAGTKYYFIDNNQEDINGFSLTAGNEGRINHFVNLYFYNLGYAAADKNSTVPTSESVTGKGTYGFTIKVYLKSNYTKNDSIGITNNGDTTSAVSKVDAENIGSILLTNYTPVCRQSSLINPDNADQKNIEVNYFWLNGVRVALIKKDIDGTSFSSCTDAGYYEIKYNNKFGVNYNIGQSYVKYYQDTNGKDFVCYAAEYLGMTKPDRFGTNKNYIYFDNHVSTKESYTSYGNVYYIGGQDLWPSGTRPTIAGQSYNYTNYNNTQLLAINPAQTLITLSSNPNTTTTSVRYELKTYLSSLGIGGINISFNNLDDDLNKELLKDGDKYYYSKFNNILSSDYTYTEYQDFVDDDIFYYLGDKYEIIQAYKFTEGSGNGSREYVLYFTVRSDVTDKKDNHVMYFLLSNVGADGQYSEGVNGIRVTFSEFDKVLKTTVTDVEGANADVDGGVTADVTYFNESANNDANKITTTDDIDGDNRKAIYQEEINPNDLRVIRISPKDGFIIQSLTLKLGGTGIFNFRVNEFGINTIFRTDSASPFEHKFLQTNAEGMPTYLMECDYDTLSSYFFYSYTDDKDNKYGIYCSVYEGNAWTTSAGAFESIYILIGGIYHDVDIQVVTASYIEFNFSESSTGSNLLGRDSNVVLRGKSYQNSNENPTIKGYELTSDSSGNLLNIYDIVESYPSIDSYALSVGGAVKEVTSGSYKYYQIQYDSSENYVTLYKKVDNRYIEITSVDDLKNENLKKYVIFKVTDESQYSYINSENEYYLSEITKLSMLVKDAGNNWVKLGAEFGKYDASLVSLHEENPLLFTRVIFIGKSEIFKNGVKIFASGEDYSVYFTNGLMYNDNGSQASVEISDGKLISNQLTAFQLLSDVEGRVADKVIEGTEPDPSKTTDDTKMSSYVALDTTIQDGYLKNINKSNYLTYMQINDLQDFFKNTVFNKDGYKQVNGDLIYNRSDYEFNRKYYFSVSLGKNEVTMNVNSYISNGNLANSGSGTTSTQKDYGSSKAYDFESMAENPSTITIKSDTRDNFEGLKFSNNLKSGFAYSVTDGVYAIEGKKTQEDINNNSKTVSPYMWLGSTLYQLDYVNNKDYKYTKSESWFNDTILTNIEYTYQNDGIKTTKNWQNIIKNYGENSYEDPNHKVSGYGISYLYRSIPGYYLNYIILETVEYGISYIDVSSLNKVGSSLSGYLKGGDNDNNENSGAHRIYYHLEMVSDVDGTYAYELKFYQEDDLNDNAGMNSIGIISNNITVSFFSHARSINITYDLNNENGNISSKEAASVTSTTQQITYDTLTPLNGIASMPGYTFVGWGSETTTSSSETRFNSSNLTWSTESAWFSVVGKSGAQNYGNIAMNVGANEYSRTATSMNLFAYDKRDGLIALGVGSYGYDFYVKSSHADRKNTTGYFITDTGYSDTENYNFWAVYANLFAGKEKNGISTSEILKDSNSNFKITLYAVWKANVYAVEINMNDFNESNGSTAASMALGRNGNSLRWNGDIADGETYGITLGDKQDKNRITYDVNKDLEDDKYYCYVTFDKNDWYLVSEKETATNAKNGAYSIKDDGANSTTSSFLYASGKYNELDFIIDRYGYSWLGWFSKKINSTFEGYYGAKQATFQNYYDNQNLVFGSDYFYAVNGYSSVKEEKAARAMPSLRYDNYSSSEFYVKLSNFEKSSDTVLKNNNGTADNTLDDKYEISNEIYSEFVYRGEKYFKDSDKNYVYHYDYKTNNTLIDAEKDANSDEHADYKYILFKNNDYLNGIYVALSSPVTNNGTSEHNLKSYNKLEGKAALVYFDTSLTLDVYADIETSNAVTVNRVKSDDGKTNYRYLTIYAYWETNNYKVTIDYRDESSDSINNIGSTDVTNKADIETNDKFEDVGTQAVTYHNGTSFVDKNKDVNSTFFDDSFFDYILNMSIPTRVGYDFLGWSFFFRDPNIYESTEFGETTGDLYKYNGLTYASTSGYILNGARSGSYATIYHEYYISADNKVKIATLYTAGGIDYIDIDGEKEGVYTALNENLETFGDAEGAGNHYIYIFAMWRAQTFTINVGLNIDTQNRDELLDNLDNSHDHDSGYSIGFYDSYNNANEPQGWVGINSLFLREKSIENNITGIGNSATINDYANVYSEIVSNVTFVLTFDELFSSARFVDPNNNSRYYLLKDIFAVSAGHYLVKWLYDSNNPDSILIADTYSTVFGYDSSLVKADGESSQIVEDLFNYEWYQKLQNSNYKKMTSDEINFEEDNTKLLTEVDFIEHGASSNFGYVTIGGKNYYIQSEWNDNDTNVTSTSNDYKTDSHNLIFRYDGKKYYIVFFNSKNNNILTNDFSHLYYTPNSSDGSRFNGNTNRYIVRFYYDDEGLQAYYVPNTAYEGMVKLSDLQIAVFESIESLSTGNISTHITDNGLNLALNTSSAIIKGGYTGFTMFTTRQFTIYANWETRNDMLFTFTNGNNGEYDEANLIKSNTSNPGLAGFAALYNEKNGSSTADVMTETYNNAGAGNNMAGEDIETLSSNFTFYDDLGFDLLPYFNGRFISKLYFDFDRIESSAPASGGAVTLHTLVRYRLEINFAWVNANNTADNIVRVTSMVLRKLKYDSESNIFVDSGELEISCAVKTITNDVSGRIVIQIDDNDPDNVANAETLRSYLSILDNDSFASKQIETNKNEGLFTISKYGDNASRNGSTYGRRDVNMLSFNLDDLISSAYITYFYSVQTYQLNIHHVFDENGDTLSQDTTKNWLYETEFTELDYNAENSLQSHQVYTDVTPAGDNQRLATIPTNLVNLSTATSFNVPYGYFLYGTFYASELVGYRPMDDYYLPNEDANYGGDTKHAYDGFNYLYQDGNYSKGKGGSDELILNNRGADLYYDQGSPLLGSAATFPNQSIRYNKSFYLFKGWFEDSNIRTGEFIVFDAYDVDDEASYVDRNITLYGYYYSNNTPTNIQFYTWNNDWNENSPAYLPYTNNKEEYTLSSSNEVSSFNVEDGYLTPVENGNYVDSEGRVIFNSKTEFGVDSSGFSNDNFNSNEIASTDISLLNNILKTYWYYEEIYTVRYAELDGIGKVYVKFDPEIRSPYVYVPSVSEEFSSTHHDAMIVDSEKYELFVNGSSGVTASDVPVLAWIDYVKDDGGNITSGTATIKSTNDTSTIMYQSDMNKYYFKNPSDGLYYIFTEGMKDTVITKLLPDKDVFYVEYEANEETVLHKVKVLSSMDKSTASIRLWDDELNDYSSTTISLGREEIYVYGDRFIGAELYAVAGNGDLAKYYKFHRVPDTVLNDNNATEFIKNRQPRYYVDMNGVRYYTFITKTNADNGGTFTGLYTDEGEPYNISFNITTLNNYFILYNGVYYRVEFTQIRDSVNVTASVTSETTSYVFEPSTNKIVKYVTSGNSETRSDFATVDFVNNSVKPISGPEQNLLYDSAKNQYYYEYNGATYTFGAVESTYVNPWLNANTVEFVHDGELTTYYFNYEINSKTTGLYEDIEITSDGVEFSNMVLFAYNVYTPINQNYTLKAALNDGKWEAADITLNAFPSLNMDYWYNNPDYVLLGYINVTDTDIATMKRSDDSDSSTTSEYMVVPSLDQIVVEDEYLKYLGDGSSYTIFANINLDDLEVVVYPGGANETTLRLFYDATLDQYYFYYKKVDESDENMTGYYYFTYSENNTIKIRQEQSGGQIFTAFSEYIADRFIGDSYLGLRLALEKAIAGKILSDFDFRYMIKAPLFVESYQLSTKDYKTIESVTMRISCQFVFTQEEIEQYGLLDYCKDETLGLAVNIGTGSNPVYQITLSTTYNYTFSLISTKTLISSNIYAVPVYVPDVIKFVGPETVVDPDSGEDVVIDMGSVVSVDGTDLVIDYMKMDVSHFDLESFRKYGSDYVWNAEDLTSEMVFNADFLQFVVLNQTQYQELTNSAIGCDVKLNSIITNNDDLLTSNDLLVQSLADAELTYKNDVVSSAKVTFDMLGRLDGDYYIFAFYYTIDTLKNTTEYVFRTTIDDIVIESTLTLEDLKTEFGSDLTEEELIQKAQDAKTGDGSSVDKYGTLTEIRYNKHINRVSDNILKVTLKGGVIDEYTVIANEKAN